MDRTTFTDSQTSLKNELQVLLDKRRQLKAAVVRNPNHPNYPEVRKTYFEITEKCKRLCDELGEQFID